MEGSKPMTFVLITPPPVIIGGESLHGEHGEHRAATSKLGRSC